MIDIPIGLNKNLPRPDSSPYGVSDPVRLVDIDRTLNWVLSMLCTHLSGQQFPARYWPQEVLDQIEAMGIDIGSYPNQNIGIPRDDWMTMMGAGGFNSITQRAVPIESTWVQIIEMLIRQHEQVSGHSDLRQGRVPYAGMSGDAIASLQHAAAGPAALKSKHTESTLQRLLQVALDAMLRWLPDRVWLEVLDDLEMCVVREIRKRASIKRMDIEVRVVTGRGGLAREEESKALALYDRGLLSKRSTMLAAGEDDPDAEIEQMTTEAAEAAGLTNPGVAGAANAGTGPPTPTADNAAGEPNPTGQRP